MTQRQVTERMRQAAQLNRVKLSSDNASAVPSADKYSFSFVITKTCILSKHSYHS